MIERVGSWDYGNSLFNEYARIQARARQTTEQISSGKVGDQYADVGDKASVLATAKISAAGIEAFSQSTTEVLTRLNIQDLHLQQLSDLSARLRGAIGDAISTGHAPAFMDEIKNLFEEATGILNAKVDGKYIYGGSRTDQPPVNVTTLAALVAAPTTADVFDNSTLKQTQRLDENETMETGILASDVGTDLMQLFKDIATFDAGAGGPLGMNLTAAQSAFLSTEHAAVPAAQQAINVIAGMNGSRHEQATNVRDRHESMAAYFAKFIGDIENVDLAEALTRLNQDQAAAEAAGRMIAQINQMSLLNFIR
ncbi:MAG: flagellin [Micropepsaceae bacterium]